MSIRFVAAMTCEEKKDVMSRLIADHSSHGTR